MRSFLFVCLFVVAPLNFLFAQRVDSLSRTKKVSRVVVAPTVLIGLGVLTINNSVFDRFDVQRYRNDHFSTFSNHADDYMQFVPIGVVFALDAFKVKPKNDLLNRSILLLKSELISNSLVKFLKHTTGVERPDKSNHTSFPSGHTAQAFLAATFLHKELGHKSIWYSIGAYTMASTVGVFRILNNKHWMSDVLAGAGFGILSVNLTYATHRYRWGKKPGMVLLPTYSDGPGLYMAMRLGN